ncbi:uncharacterized protein [Spinacia oleracea]|uniref:MULE transposase domain-containing protein n=1 Tax=Spinacia oleracea TaxID=3562 RepID=A0ABM3RHP9_SPIOL|nr:uncharacterized protein LOC110783211 [Spinacia oleracea]
MENSNYPLVGSFTRMLNDDQFFINQMNIDYGTHTSLLDTCTSPITNHLQQEPIGLDELQFVSLNRNNVDSDGVDREGEDANEELHMVGDDIIVEEEVDEEENVVALGATVQEFSRLSDVNDDEVNKWITWISMVSYKLGAEFCVGQEFSNKGALNEAVTSYSIKKNQRFIVLESRPHTVTFKCGRKPIGCSWKLRGSQKSYSSDVFTIVSYQGPHDSTCVSDILQLDHRNMDSKFISYHIRNLVEADISIKVRVLIEVIKQQYHFTISYKKAWLAKQKAIAYTFGDWEESFQILPHFMQEMKKANPGTVVHFANHRTADPNFEIFQRVFWAFGPSIQGFQHCRPIITIDGTHLYGKYKGTILIAMSVDANNQIFPLAFAIVEGENGDSWPWFMACIRRFVTQRTGLCVLSDRHLGIMKAMTQDNSGWTEPYAYHRFCIRHLTSNVNTEFKNRELKNKVGWTAFQQQKKKFDYGLNMIAKMNEKAREYIGKINASKWSLCHDGGYRYGLKTTNLAEVFNNVLKGARFLPITALVKLTFYRVNSYFVERRRLSKKRLLDGHAYTIKVTKDLDTNTEKAMHHKVDIFHHEHGIYQADCLYCMLAVCSVVSASSYWSVVIRLHYYYKSPKCGKDDGERIKNPPPDLPQEQWEWLVEHYGSDEFKIVSQRNSKNRLSENRCVHTTGNLAFVEVEDIMTKENDGVKPSADVIWLIEHTHTNKEDKLEWADGTRSKIIHEKLKNIVATAGDSMTQEEILIHVLDHRSGYVREKGTALRSYSKGKYQMEQRRLAEQQEKIHEQEQRIKELEEIQQKQQEEQKRQQQELEEYKAQQQQQQAMEDFKRDLLQQLGITRGS